MQSCLNHFVMNEHYGPWLYMVLYIKPNQIQFKTEYADCILIKPLNFYKTSLVIDQTDSNYLTSL